MEHANNQGCHQSRTESTRRPHRAKRDGALATNTQLGFRTFPESYGTQTRGKSDTLYLLVLDYWF
jgi:hypothetical protein